MNASKNSSVNHNNYSNLDINSNYSESSNGRNGSISNSFDDSRENSCYFNVSKLTDKSMLKSYESN